MTKMRIKKEKGVSKKEILDVIEKKHTSKKEHAKLQDIFNLSDDNQALEAKVRALQERKLIFKYQGNYYPWKELHPLHGTMYETIKKDVLEKLANWEKFRAEPMDPVHIHDDKEDYHPDENKIHITWKALIEVITHMTREGVLENED